MPFKDKEREREYLISISTDKIPEISLNFKDSNERYPNLIRID